MENCSGKLYLPIDMASPVLQQTQAIVLHTTAVSETSIVVHLYTAQWGRSSFMIKGVRKKNARFSMAGLHPLALINIQLNYRENKELNLISSFSPFVVLNQTTTHPQKIPICFFLAEVLYRCLRQSEEDAALFVFLVNTIQCLENKAEALAYFPIIFLLKLSRFLGFYPNIDQADLPYFDLKEGAFVAYRPLHTMLIEGQNLAFFAGLLQAELEDRNTLGTALQRKEVLYLLVEYYRMHLEGMSPWKSLAVLATL